MPENWKTIFASAISSLIVVAVVSFFTVYKEYVAMNERITDMIATHKLERDDLKMRLEHLENHEKRMIDEIRKQIGNRYSLDEAMKKRRIRAAMAQIALLAAQLDLYYVDVSSFPTTLQGMKALRVRPVGLTDPKKWDGPYSNKDIPPDPWDGPYLYASDDGQSYSLRSNGPDGQPGTDDDIVQFGFS